MKISKSLLVVFTMFIFSICAYCQTQDNAIFTLPETPPTIQKLDKTPLDKPVLKRQAFVSDEELTLSPVWINNDFSDVQNQKRDFSIGFYGGNFETMGGFVNYSSTGPFDVLAEYRNSQGESKIFASEKGNLNISYKNFASQQVFISANAQANEQTFNEQSKDMMGASLKAHFYCLKDVSIETDLEGREFSLAQTQKNNLLSASFLTKILPFNDTLTMAKFYASQNTGFLNAKNYYTAEFWAQSVLFTNFSVGAGFNLRNANFALNGKLIYKISDYFSASAGFDSGLQELLWQEIYGKERFYSSNEQILNPENKYEITQTLSCNILDKFLFSSTYFQRSQTNSLVFLYDALNNTIYPSNIEDSYVSGLRVATQYNGVLNLKIEAEKLLNRSSELMCEQSETISAEYSFYDFKLKPSYSFVPQMYYDYAASIKTLAYNNAAFSIEKPLSKRVTLTLGTQNILSDKQEIQPNFITKEAKYEAGLVINF